MRRQFEFLNEYDERTQLQLLQRPSEVGFYIQDNWRVNSRCILKPGIRVSYFTEDENEFYFEPRFSAKYKLRDGEYLTYATGIYRQFIFTVQDEYNPSIINNWFAVDETVEAGFSVHNIIGYEKELWTTTTLQLEFYHKTLDNMLTYRETRASVDEVLGTNVRAIDFFVPTDGYSYGMELFLHKKYGRLAGWVGYTLNWARQTIDDETFNASFDRRNNLDVLMSYDLGKNWRFSMQFNYGTGFPFTRVEGSYLEVDGSGLLPRRRLLYGDRFAFRLPAYHRLDFGFSKYFKWFNMDWRLDLQVINAYNRENVFFYEWDFDENPAERTVIPMLPIVPSIGISTEF